MRYPDGGGLTAAGRARRESVRLHAARMYEHDVSPVQVQVARRLRVSTKSACQWRRRWRAGGETALMSRAGHHFLDFRAAFGVSLMIEYTFVL